MKTSSIVFTVLQIKNVFMFTAQHGPDGFFQLELLLLLHLHIDIYLLSIDICELNLCKIFKNQNDQLCYENSFVISVYRIHTIEY